MSDLLALPRAVVELARARLILRRLTAADIPALNRRFAAHSTRDTADEAVVERVARLVPAAAAYVPWRSDCLVQAIAAQHWLADKGVSGSIALGVDRAEGSIEPHAWLQVGDRVVTGGPIERYTVFLSGDGLSDGR